MVGFDLIRHVQGMPANFTRNQGLNAEQIRMTAQPSHAAHVVASVNVQCAVRSAIMFLVSEHGNAVQAKEALLPVRVCGLSLALNHATTPRLAGCRRNHEAAYRSPDSASALTMFDITTASLAPQHAYVLLTLLVSVFTYVHPQSCMITEVRPIVIVTTAHVNLQGAHVHAAESRQSPQEVSLFYCCSSRPLHA